MCLGFVVWRLGLMNQLFKVQGSKFNVHYPFSVFHSPLFILHYPLSILHYSVLGLRSSDFFQLFFIHRSPDRYRGRRWTTFTFQLLPAYCHCELQTNFILLPTSQIPPSVSVFGPRSSVLTLHSSLFTIHFPNPTSNLYLPTSYFVSRT